MMPAEITSTTGSSFNYDKLFILIPEFRTCRYDMESAKVDYYRARGLKRDVLTHSKGDKTDREELLRQIDEFIIWFSENKDQFKLVKPEFKKINYDFTKSLQDNTRAARNNLIIDWMWSVLTHQDTASKIIKGSTPTEHIRTGRVISILESCNLNELVDLLGIDEMSGNLTEAVADRLLKMPLDEAEALTKQLGDRLEPLSQTTHTIFHQRNMVGNKMIGIYAIHNAQHALLQQTRDISNPKSGVYPVSYTHLDVYKRQEHDLDLSTIEIINQHDQQWKAKREEYARRYTEQNWRKGGILSEAKDKMFGPNYFGMMMVRCV